MQFLGSWLRWLVATTLGKNKEAWRIIGNVTVSPGQLEWSWLRMSLQTNEEWICLSEPLFDQQGRRMKKAFLSWGHEPLGLILREPHHPASLPPLRRKGGKREKCSVLLMVPWLGVGGADQMDGEIIRTLQAVCRVTVITEEGFVHHDGDLDHLPLPLFPAADHERVIAHVVESRSITHLYCRNSMACYRSLPRYPMIRRLDLLHSPHGWLERSNEYWPHLEGRAAVSRLPQWMGPTRCLLRGFIDHRYHQLASSDGCGKLVWIGRMEEEKNPERWIEVFRESGFAQGLMIGEGSLLTRLNTTGIQMTRRFLSPTTEIMKLLSANDTLLLSSRSEGLPLVVLEALQMGLRVVMPPVGAWQELLRLVKSARLLVGEDLAGLVRYPPIATTAPDLRLFSQRRFRRNVYRFFLHPHHHRQRHRQRHLRG